VKSILFKGLFVLVALSACESGVLGGDGLGISLSRYAPERVRVSGNDVVIAGPQGFCIDPTETKDDAKSSFVLLGSCAAISKSRFKPRPKVPAILMATVSTKNDSAPIAASMKALAGFFKSEAGRVALSRDGKAGTVEVIDTLGKGGVFYIHARDSSTGTLAGAGDEYWRALFDVKGRIVSASVVGLEERPISTRAGFSTLNAFVSRIVNENPPATQQIEGNKPAPSIPKRLY